MGAFWSRYQPQKQEPEFPPEPRGSLVRVAGELAALGMGVEFTPLFWVYAFVEDQRRAYDRRVRERLREYKRKLRDYQRGRLGKKPKKPKKPKEPKGWSPNPEWLRPVADPKAALAHVLAYMTTMVNTLKTTPAFAQIKRWVVINEPMNIIMRRETRDAPFLKALLPTAPDPRYARDERAPGTEPPVKLTPQAYDNLAAMLKHMHVLVPDDSLLIVNDYGIEGCDGERGLTGMRGQRFRELMTGLLARVGNDPALRARLRVGLQGHLKSGGELDGDETGERNDFELSSVRKQMRWFHDKKLRLCVTECDLQLDIPSKEHVDKGTVVEGGVRKKVPGYEQTMDFFFVKNKKRRQRYVEAFRAQRLDQRDLLAAILGWGNLDSLAWWDFMDDLPEGQAGSNFRYHGYLFHPFLVCDYCKNDPLMQAIDDPVVENGPNKIYYKKPNYWGTVAALKKPANRPFARPKQKAKK
jgi:hypothetical protein